MTWCCHLSTHPQDSTFLPLSLFLQSLCTGLVEILSFGDWLPHNFYLIHIIKAEGMDNDGISISLICKSVWSIQSPNASREVWLTCFFSTVWQSGCLDVKMFPKEKNQCQVSQNCATLWHVSQHEHQRSPYYRWYSKSRTKNHQWLQFSHDKICVSRNHITSQQTCTHKN